MMTPETIHQSPLFSDLNSEESANLSGGGRRRHNHGGGGHMGPSSTPYFDLQAYLFGLGAGVVFGNPTLTQDEIQYVWERSLSL